MYNAQDSYQVCFISIQDGRANGQLSCPETAGNPLRLGTALLSGAGPDLGDDGRNACAGRDCIGCSRPCSARNPAACFPVAKCAKAVCRPRPNLSLIHNFSPFQGNWNEPVNIIIFDKASRMPYTLPFRVRTGWLGSVCYLQTSHVEDGTRT